MSRLYQAALKTGIGIVDSLTGATSKALGKSSDKIKWMNNSVYHSPSELLIEKNIFQKETLYFLSKIRNGLDKLLWEAI